MSDSDFELTALTFRNGSFGPAGEERLLTVWTVYTV